MERKLIAMISVAMMVFASATTHAVAPQPPPPEVAIFAGGCFWSTEKAFEETPGVTAVVSGFAGGQQSQPTYAEVVRGRTGHLEAVRVTYDPRLISYRQLVDRFWRMIDPTDPNGVFCDQGPSYRTAVFATPAQREVANASRNEAQRALGRRFVTPVRAATRFWPVAEAHQNYAQRQPAAYERYRVGCRRTEGLRRVWGDAAIT